MEPSVPKPSEWEGIFHFVESLIGHPIPIFARIALGVLVLTALVLLVCAVIAVSAAKLKELWSEKFRPRAYGPEQRQRVRARRQFAEYLAREVKERNDKESWRDEQFAELEAEVEAEGGGSWFWRILRSPTGIRRERSLARALEKVARG